MYQILYFEHIMRVHGDRLGKPIMTGMGGDKRKRERPDMIWTDEIRDTAKLVIDESGEATRDD